jgi:ATP-binding cassette subfamily C protein
MRNEQTGYIELKATSELLSKISSAVFISLFIYLSVKILHARPAQLLLIITIFFRLWPRIAVMQSSAEQIASCLPAFKVLAELNNECHEAREIKDRDFNNQSKSQVCIEQGIECRNVFFRYNPQEPIYALQDISIHIPANRMIAIVGRSGAGKSTLIDVLMGLMQPERGEVLLDGVPLVEDKILALRRSISYVPQDPFLFNASIRDNLLLIDPNAPEEELWRALELSVSAEFVKRLPQGLDTVIGDRGVRLSGGERQRLVLARAILRKPSILVLDEATSSLDTENEKKVQEVLERLKGTVTIVVIAHRLSTIRNADQVIVLDQGKVIQRGRFTQLARDKKGLFSNLLENQIVVGL